MSCIVLAVVADTGLVQSSLTFGLEGCSDEIMMELLQVRFCMGDETW